LLRLIAADLAVAETLLPNAALAHLAGAARPQAANFVEGLDREMLKAGFGGFLCSHSLPADHISGYAAG
jgi:hypothetical protein